MFSIEQRNLLFNKPLDTIPNIDPISMDVLRSISWFNEEEFNQTYKKEVENRKLKWEQNREYFREFINVLYEDLDYDFKCKLDAIVVEFLEDRNLNYYHNPIEIYDGSYDDISCDSSSGFDGRDGKMNCWKLEENSRTDRRYMNITDAFDGSWQSNDNDIDQLYRLSKIFVELGFEVYFVQLNTWRKGYDYNVTELTEERVKNNNSLKTLIDKYSSCAYEFQYFRFYIRKIY